MDVNLERISQVIRSVDVLIELGGVANDLSEEMVKDFISRALMFAGIDLTEEEYEAVKRDINWKYKIFTLPGQSIVADYEQEKWYEDAKANIVPVFWTKYKNYLIDIKKFSPNIVSTLGEETLDQKLMNYLGNPKSEVPFLKRGLIIGDVQSGKTSTYIGLICKAADAGYKVFILLTGTIEGLRKQTQERVEEGFVGINLAADTTGGQRVGVGLDNKQIHAMAMTSRTSDFTGNSDKIAVSLADKDAVIFVIKKNASVLKKLTDWLISLNADPITKKIDLPMLLIDDEADNASVNTSADKEDPTKINRMIRELVNVFTKSNYVGFTATPFANVFIDPESTEKMETQDLFPEDFIIALPTPSNYIGPNQIFPKDAPYHSQLIYIEDAGREEEDGWPFYFKHKKHWDDVLPNSLTDALFTFYLANAIRDLRGDKKSHRSMLINMSRFVKVQYAIKEQIEQLHERAYRAIKFNLSDNFDESMRDPILKRIYKNWNKQYVGLEFTWKDIVRVLFTSIENIQIKVVNSSKNSEKLVYPENESMRVIAVGGLALSRGLTLEGLVVSYFYRNTCTYDVLMQMGRWFGYRKGYDDLFRIWTHQDSAEWYSEIAEATEKLKNDMSVMRELELKPKNFGIRVRNNSEELKITAYNKMRNSTDEYEYESYFGGVVETPYVIYDVNIQKNNFKVLENAIEGLIAKDKRFDSVRVRGAGEHFVLFDVEKNEIIRLLSQLKISKYNADFDVQQINDFLTECNSSIVDSWNIAFLGGSKSEERNTYVEFAGRKIYKVQRKTCMFNTADSRLSIGRKGKLGGPNDGMLGIEAVGEKTVEDIIEDAKKAYRQYYKEKNFIDFTDDKSYASNTWFRFVTERKPLLMIYLVDVDSKEQENQAREFRKEMNGVPVVCLAMGLPMVEDETLIGKNRYKANKIYNWFERDSILAETEEEE